MEYSTYNRILKNIKDKAPLESGVQTLVYMLVFEIIKDKELDIVIIDRMQKRSVFMSYGYISDLAIVDRDFEYDTSDREKIKMCIEVKAINETINNKEQVKKQLLTYKKAIITNGEKWAFYELASSYDNLETSISEIIEKEKKLAEEKRDLKILYLKKTKGIKKNIEEIDIEEIDKEINKKNESIEEINNEIEEERAKIDNQINYKSIQPIEDGFFEIDENNFDNFCNKLKAFIITPDENVKNRM